MADIEVRLTGWGISGSPRDDQQPALGARRLAVRAAGLRHQLEGQEAGGQGTDLQDQGAVSRRDAAGDGVRDQRRRLALSPDPRRLRGGGARLQQSVGHRLRRQGPAADQRLRHPAPVARDSRRHLSPAGRTAFQPVRLQRHPDHRRSPAPLRARRRPRSTSPTRFRSRRPAASSWPTSTSTRCCRTCWCGRARDSPRTTATISCWPTTRSGSASASRSVPTARSTCSTGTTATSAARTRCTRRPAASSGSRRSSRWRRPGPAATPICAR